MKNETLTTEERKKSNDLRHTFIKIKGKEKTVVKIHLNDECNNGHQDFSIVCDIYESKHNGQWYYNGGGAAHDHILKLFPDLQIFVNLHLCAYSGVPMYAVENGFYHLRHGFNNTKVTDSKFKAEFCEYYRITPEQFDALNMAENETRYALILESLGVLTQWKEEADRAITLLEEWTGKEFLVDSKKSQFHAPTQEQRETEKEREEKGYYTPENIQKREEHKKLLAVAKQYADIEQDRDKEIAKATKEYEIKKAVLDGGFPVNSVIYYSHTNEACFNWHTTKITQEQFDTFVKSVRVDGIKWNIKL